MLLDAIFTIGYLASPIYGVTLLVLYKKIEWCKYSMFRVYYLYVHSV